ncbi:hypothetical protein MRQ36_01540 [Micromonospora sp. R77]|uniref:hypothetical protein n=1 Tax=Micromonospora sp. R77 TaxID=2925836 RepID=UPI001F60C045|nr:hypothetical protein [Micromonospora sp. R77]MCI4061324.1 hypothetical protein [Micromonospora sp. R77]
MVFSRWREPNAPTAMLAAAAARGWQQVAPPTLVGLQPPVLARADVEELSGRRPTPCEYWAAASPDGMLASHLSVFHDEYDTASFDMVAWDAPATVVPLPHAELSLHRHGRQHHRLSDRFRPHGSTTVAVPVAGLRLTVRRDCAAPAVTALAHHPALGALVALLDQDRGGARLDTLDGRCALWRLTAGPRRGANRWQALLDASLVARQILADSSAAR